MLGVDSDGMNPVSWIRAAAPWWLRIGAKIVLARVPAKHDLWRRLNVFAHGRMEHPEYALEVFQRHFANSGLQLGSPFVGLELGPGDSLASALIAKVHGAAFTYLVDAGPFAILDIRTYQALALYLKSEGFDIRNFESIRDVGEMLGAFDASYHSQGLQSLRKLPAGSVDFIWSQAVLEHVRRDEVGAFAREMRRVLRDSGLCSHQIDLKDHIGGSLNNLRISSGWWEREWMATSGFYTNRLRKCEFVRIFEDAGFDTKIVSTHCWDECPIDRPLLAREFHNLPDDELRVKDFLIVLRPV